MAKQTKGELHTDLYVEYCARLTEEARTGEFDHAITTAVQSLESIPLVIHHLGKTVGEVPRFESIDFILRFAPPLLHQESLDTLSAFLKSKRSVVQKLPHDILGDLELAYSQIKDAYRAWNYLLTKESISHEELCEELGEPHDRWELVTTQWQQFGFLLRDTERGDDWRLVGSFAQKVRGKCPNCGAMGIGGLYKLLEGLSCPRCNHASSFVIIDFQV